MRIKLSNVARNAVVDTLTALIDTERGGSGAIELLSGSGVVLAKLRFAKPCSPSATNGITKFFDIDEDGAAKATGVAVEARIVNAAGGEIFRCDVGDEKSDAVIRLNSNSIVAGGPVRIREFSLTMPS